MLDGNSKKTKIKSKKREFVEIFFTGFGMGVADLVPGVSGGTIAFLAGIYGRLINSIKQVTGTVLKFAVRLHLKEAWRATPWRFLLPLVLGILTAIATLARLISFLLSDYPVFVWSFFFGLVLASVFVIARRINTWDFNLVLLFFFAALSAFFISKSIPVETPATALLFFVSGAIAISATILPGISGSFLLVIMGKYEQLLNAVTERDFIVLGIFILGAMVGLALFSRLLSWWFRNHHNTAIAVLSGFILGSLYSIWPWREGDANILPVAFDLSVLFAIVLAFIGFLLILLLGKFSLNKDYRNEL